MHEYMRCRRRYPVIFTPDKFTPDIVTPDIVTTDIITTGIFRLGHFYTGHILYTTPWNLRIQYHGIPGILDRRNVLFASGLRPQY